MRRREVHSALCGVPFTLLSLRPSAEPPSGERVGFHLHRPLKVVLIEMKVNGKLCTFIVDTGAAITVVDMKILGGALDLPPSRMQGSEAGLVGTAEGRPANLELGPLRWPNHIVAVMNLAHVEKFYRQQIDGLLGQDLMLKFRQVTFDYETSQLILVR